MNYEREVEEIVYSRIIIVVEETEQDRDWKEEGTQFS